MAATTRRPGGGGEQVACAQPHEEAHTDTAAAHRVTLLKLRQTRMAVRAGKMIRLEMSMVPITRMPSTMVTAVSSAMSML